jgi:hypothetical protein
MSFTVINGQGEWVVEVVIAHRAEVDHLADRPVELMKKIQFRQR